VSLVKRIINKCTNFSDVFLLDFPEIAEIILNIFENPIAYQADVQNKLIFKDWGQQ
jgi:hypothetical protein